MVTNFKEIQKAVKGKTWTAKETFLSKLSPEEQKRRLGLQKGDAKTGAMCIPTDGLKLPTNFDWRNNNGNWITPIRNQQGCGACASFSAIAMIEALMKIAGRDTSKTFDLSEWDLFLRAGGSCSAGSNHDRILSAAQKGICDESCYPYLTEEPRCPDYNKRLTYIKSYTKLGSESTMKNWILDKGPIVIGMDVPEDMMNYDSGIYTWEYGNIVGGHGVCVVGWNDLESYWIIKNSWGEAFGESGWIRIDYQTLRDMGLLKDYPVYGATLVSSGPIGNMTGVLIHTNGSLSADIYVDGKIIGQTDTPLELKPGTYDSTIKKQNYKDFSLQFTVAQDNLNELNITMLEGDRAWICKQTSRVNTGIFKIGIQSPEDKIVMTTGKYGVSFDLGSYPKNTPFIFKLIADIKDPKTGKIEEKVFTADVTQKKNPNAVIINLNVGKTRGHRVNWQKIIGKYSADCMTDFLYEY